MAFSNNATSCGSLCHQKKHTQYTYVYACNSRVRENKMLNGVAGLYLLSEGTAGGTVKSEKKAG